jgi:hypothetical protein
MLCDEKLQLEVIPADELFAAWLTEFAQPLGILSEGLKVQQRKGDQRILEHEEL